MPVLNSVNIFKANPGLAMIAPACFLKPKTSVGSRRLGSEM
jgi:hypothetical protein